MPLDGEPLGPKVQGRERRRVDHRQPFSYGTLTAPELNGIINDRKRGKLRRWVELCDHAITSDADVLSYYETRIERVLQADWTIAVQEENAGDQSAALQAEFVREMVLRIPNFASVMRDMLDAETVGHSASEGIFEYDRVRRIYFVREVRGRNSARFRYGPGWDGGVHRDLRLYDYGERPGHDSYGEVLEPHKWITHFYSVKKSLPSHFGIMTAGIWWWMFRRWNLKGWLSYTERFGVPHIHIECPPNTPAETRDEIREKMEQMSYDSNVTVAEAGVIVHMHESQGKGTDAHSVADTAFMGGLERLFLGASDIASQGDQGSHGAVTGRIAAVADPRMVGSGVRVSETFQATLFHHILFWNMARLGITNESQIIVPEMRLETAADEISTDESDLQQEQDAQQREEESPQDGEARFTSRPNPLQLALNGLL